MRSMGSVRSLKRWKQKLRNGESLANMRPGPQRGSILIMSPDVLEELRGFKLHNPDASLNECVEWLAAAGCSVLRKCPGAWASWLHS